MLLKKLEENLRGVAAGCRKEKKVSPEPKLVM